MLSVWLKTGLKFNHWNFCLFDFLVCCLGTAAFTLAAAATTGSVYFPDDVALNGDFIFYAVCLRVDFAGELVISIALA